MPMAHHRGLLRRFRGVPLREVLKRVGHSTSITTDTHSDVVIDLLGDESVEERFPPVAAGQLPKRRRKMNPPRDRARTRAVVKHQDPASLTRRE